MDVYPELLSQPLALGLNLFKQGAADIARPDQADGEGLLGEEEAGMQGPKGLLGVTALDYRTDVGFA